MANEVDRSIFVIKVVRAGFKLAVSQRERERERERAYDDHCPKLLKLLVD